MPQEAAGGTRRETAERLQSDRQGLYTPTQRLDTQRTATGRARSLAEASLKCSIKFELGRR